jgi:hypothetical protein
MSLSLIETLPSDTMGFSLSAWEARYKGHFTKAVVEALMRDLEGRQRVLLDAGMSHLSLFYKNAAHLKMLEIIRSRM